MVRKRIVMARKTTIDRMDRSFDLEFWRRVGSEGRFAAAWQMVRELRRMRGLDEREPRLQRSVARILKRAGEVSPRGRLLANKRKVGRPVDELDARALLAVRSRRRRKKRT